MQPKFCELGAVATSKNSGCYMCCCYGCTLALYVSHVLPPGSVIQAVLGSVVIAKDRSFCMWSRVLDVLAPGN
jgi:hypothetical protein